MWIRQHQRSATVECWSILSGDLYYRLNVYSHDDTEIGQYMHDLTSHVRRLVNDRFQRRLRLVIKSVGANLDESRRHVIFSLRYSMHSRQMFPKRRGHLITACDCGLRQRRLEQRGLCTHVNIGSRHHVLGIANSSGQI